MGSWVTLAIKKSGFLDLISTNKMFASIELQKHLLLISLNFKALLTSTFFCAYYIGNIIFALFS